MREGCGRGAGGVRPQSNAKRHLKHFEKSSVEVRFEVREVRFEVREVRFEVREVRERFGRGLEEVWVRQNTSKQCKKTF